MGKQLIPQIMRLGDLYDQAVFHSIQIQDRINQL